VQPFDFTPYITAGVGTTSFGQDAKGELYLMGLLGDVYRIVPSP